ncbi:MAG: DNA-directed RNA polymerase subunit omega [Lachnospiraceae bacterium]
MLHPSYYELIEDINKDNENGEYPVIESRYTLVIAAAKRARQLIGGADSEVKNFKNKKPLSVAVEELDNRQVRITGTENGEQL